MPPLAPFLEHKEKVPVSLPLRIPRNGLQCQYFSYPLQRTECVGSSEMMWSEQSFAHTSVGDHIYLDHIKAARTSMDELRKIKTQ